MVSSTLPYSVPPEEPTAMPVVETGFLALGNQNWLVGQVDGAITALGSGGVLQDLAAAHGLQLPDND